MSMIDKIIDEIQATRYQAIDDATCELLLVHKIIDNRSEYKDAKHIAQRLMHSGYSLEVKYFDKGKGAQDVRVILSRTVDSKSMHFPSPFAEEEVLSKEPAPETDGWKPIAVTEECLKPSDEELLIIVAYEREIDGKKQYKTSMESFSPVTIKEYIKLHSLKVLSESEVNKKYHGTPR